MKKQGDVSFIDEIEELSAMPSLITEVTAMLNAPLFDTKAIEEKIKLDPAMATFILKFCNSPFLGLKAPVVNLHYALDLIGPTTSKSILMSYFLRNLSDKAEKKTISNYLWEHSVFVAVIARELATHLNLGKIAEEAYMAGLLHDIGKLAIYLHDPENYENLLQESDGKRESTLPMENDRYGCTHVDAGYYLLNRWGLSDLLKDAAHRHHDIQDYQGGMDVVKLTAFANSMLHCEIEKQGELPAFFLKEYSLSEDKYQEILDSIYFILAKAQAEIAELL